MDQPVILRVPKKLLDPIQGGRQRRQQTPQEIWGGKLPSLICDPEAIKRLTDERTTSTPPMQKLIVHRDTFEVEIGGVRYPIAITPIVPIVELKKAGNGNETSPTYHVKSLGTAKHMYVVGGAPVPKDGRCYVDIDRDKTQPPPLDRVKAFDVAKTTQRETVELLEKTVTTLTNSQQHKDGPICVEYDFTTMVSAPEWMFQTNFPVTIIKRTMDDGFIGGLVYEQQQCHNTTVNPLVSDNREKKAILDGMNAEYAKKKQSKKDDPSSEPAATADATAAATTTTTAKGNKTRNKQSKVKLVYKKRDGF
jgi:hypothetical protein